MARTSVSKEVVHGPTNFMVPMTVIKSEIRHQARDGRGAFVWRGTHHTGRLHNLGEHYVAFASTAGLLEIGFVK